MAGASSPPRVLARVRTLVDALDPNDDPHAEPISLLALTALLAAVAFSVFTFLRWKFQPMQDLGHHTAFTAIFAGYGKAGSLYPAIYKPLDWLSTNSLLYTIAGGLGKMLPASWGSWIFRITLSTYVAFVPLANLYALRTFGRSAWGALIAVPLCYNQMFIYGFANFLFAAPLMILALPLFHRLLTKPTKVRFVAVALTVFALFLAHFHLFLWTGVLLFVMTSSAFVRAVALRARGPLPPGAPGPLSVVVLSALAVAPALLLLARWYLKTSGPAPDDEYTSLEVGHATWEGFLEALRGAKASFTLIHSTLLVTHGESEWEWNVGLLCLGFVAVAARCLHGWRRPPVMELACLATIASYFFLPQDFMGQAVIGSRHVAMGLWLAPALFAPVPRRSGAWARWAVIVGLLWLNVAHFREWTALMWRFQHEEVAGLGYVLRAAPPRLRMHYVKIEPDSAIFAAHTFWHVDKWYMLDKQGQVDENPAYATSQAVRYRSTHTPRFINAHYQDWPSVAEIWEHFDLVLVHRWRPSPEQLAAAEAKGERLAKAGDWELWRSRVAQP